MRTSEFTAVDFNAGLGGRSFAFLDCGFSVVAAVESDPAKQEILHGIVPDVPVFTEPVSFENLPSLPGADIVVAGIPAERFAREHKGRAGLHEDESFAYLLSEFILRHHPKAFLLQVPTA